MWLTNGTRVRALVDGFALRKGDTGVVLFAEGMDRESQEVVYRVQSDRIRMPVWASYPSQLELSEPPAIPRGAQN